MIWITADPDSLQTKPLTDQSDSWGRTFEPRQILIEFCGALHWPKVYPVVFC